jgi:hypothetical protein
MRSRAQFTKRWSRVPLTGIPRGLRATNDWVAVVDQHHRMVQALTMATAVRPPQRTRDADTTDVSRSRREFEDAIVR